MSDAPFEDRLHRAVRALCEAWERNPEFREEIEDVVEEVLIKHSARLVVELIRGNGIPADLAPARRVSEPSAWSKLSNLKETLDGLTSILGEIDAGGSNV